MEILFGFGAVAHHVVVVGGAGAVHFMDRFHYMFVNCVQVMPVTNLRGQSCAGNEREGEGENRESLLHEISSGIIVHADTRTDFFVFRCGKGPTMVVFRVVTWSATIAPALPARSAASLCMSKNDVKHQVTEAI